jgi:hypothetical protein
MAEEWGDETTAASTSTKTSKEQGDSESAGAAELPVGEGPLLEKDREGVVKLLNRFWEDTEPLLGEYRARWKANGKRREGVIGVTVVKPDPDKAEWKVWAPPGAARVPPTFNQPARLARRLVSNLFQDKPLPEVTPGGASDNDKPDAAEFQTRILQDVCTSSKFNVPEMAEKAVDKACTFDSAFVRVWVDPKGGGSRPRTIMASKAAVTVDDALYVDGDGSTPQEPPYITRYVKAGDELTDDPRLAEREWLPGLRHERLTGLNLRPIPATATELEECDGVIIRTPAKLGDLRKQYPEAIAELDNEQLWELVGQRPKNSQDVTEGQPASVTSKKNDDDEPPGDDVEVIVTMCYMGETATYPAGAYVVAAGEKFLLHRQKWEILVNEVPETLPIPIAHFKGWEEGKDTFYGYHLMHFLGPGQEVRAAALGGAIEHIDRFNRRKVFYTPQTLFQAKMAPASTGVMVPVQQGSEPKVEQFPEYPRIGLEILNLATNELNDESGLQAIAQGMTDPTVQSGLHAQKIIEQVNIGLGGIKRSTEKGVERLWTIAAAFIRGYYTVPQQIRFRGDDQEHKQKDFSAVDMSDAKDVRIMKGSFTMLAPSAKLAVAEYMRKLNLIDDNQLRRMAGGNIGGLMGIQDDPAMLRIRRQISLWEDGPPKSEHPSEPLPDEYPGETAIEEPQNAPAMDPMVDPAAIEAAEGPVSDPAVIGSIAPAGPPAPDPMVLAGQQIFRPVPNDIEPAIAQVRFRELSQAMCSKKYERQPEVWRQVFDAEYDRMRKAAGVTTAEEASQAQAQAAEAAKKAEAEKSQMEAQAKTQGDLQLAQLKSQEAMQLEALRAQNALDLEKLRLEHESLMKELELQNQSGEADAGAADIEKKRLEIEQKMVEAEARLRQDYDLAVMKMKQEATLAREKLSLEQKHALRVEKVKANPGLELTTEAKELRIVRNAAGQITGAEIVPVVSEVSDDDDPDPDGGLPDPEMTEVKKDIKISRNAAGQVSGAVIAPVMEVDQGDEPAERSA